MHNDFNRFTFSGGLYTLAQVNSILWACPYVCHIFYHSYNSGLKSHCCNNDLRYLGLQLFSLTMTFNNRAGGGELLDNLTKQMYISETDIAGYIRQVLWGLEHMHIQNIAHLGLTVSNDI